MPPQPDPQSPPIGDPMPVPDPNGPPDPSGPQPPPKPGDPVSEGGLADPRDLVTGAYNPLPAPGD